MVRETYKYKNVTVICMGRKKTMGWTTIPVPMWVRDKLASYGTKRESWWKVIIRLLEEVEDARRMKEKYKLR